MTAGRRISLLGLAAAAWLASGLAEAAEAREPLRHRPHCQVGLFCLSAERQQERISLWLDSETDRPLTLAIRLEARNLTGAEPVIRTKLDAPGRRRLALLRIAVPGDWDLRWRYSFHPGTKPARHDPEAPYRLPYPAGASYRVIQGAEGPFSHRGALAHAIDWAMPPGSPVLAARAGIVIGLRDGAGPGGPDPERSGQENFVWLRHRDGTVGHYLHLAAGSLPVGLGDAVARGQAIGRSGNSGYSTEPHLHFHVSAPTPMGADAFETFPLDFDLGASGRGRPIAGQSYRARLP